MEFFFYFLHYVFVLLPDEMIKKIKFSTQYLNTYMLFLWINRNKYTTIYTYIYLYNPKYLHFILMRIPKSKLYWDLSPAIELAYDEKTCFIILNISSFAHPFMFFFGISMANGILIFLMECIVIKFKYFHRKSNAKWSLRLNCCYLDAKKGKH